MDNREVKIKHGQSKLDYILSGLIRCDKCGSSFTGFYKSNKRGYKHRYYGCSNKSSVKGCDVKNVNAADLENLIIETLKNELLRDDLIERIADEIMKNYENHSGTVKEKEGEIKKELSDIKFKTENLLKVLLDGFDSQTVVIS